MQKETFNGYANRTTWNLSLWLANEFDLYTASHSFAVACVKVGYDPVKGMQEWTRKNWNSFPTIARLDIGADLSAVDWAEIAESLLGE